MSMQNKPVIMETRRLILRPWKKNKADAKALYRYAKDARVGPAAGWPVHKDVAESLQIIRDVLSTPGIYALVLKETREPVGAAGVTYGSTGRKYLKEHEAEIGYWIGVPYWGQGLVPEAVRRLLAMCFEELDMETVWCGYYDDNVKSRRVQEKCGFVYDHKEENVRVEALNEYRTEHFTKLTRQRWMTGPGKELLNDDQDHTGEGL